MAPKFSKNGKRLGRPPKNPQSQIVEKKQTSTVFNIITPAVMPKKEEILAETFGVGETIPCEFVPIPRYEIVKSPTEEKKLGTYSSCAFVIDDFNNGKWVVFAYLKADFDSYRKKGFTNTQILQRCINFLNAVEPRKKYAKKDPVPKYGNLKLLNEEMNFTKKFGYECAIVMFTTDERKCEHFWGEGDKYY